MNAFFSSGWGWAALAFAVSALGVLLSVVILAWKQGRSEGKSNQAIKGLAHSHQETKKDVEALWAHQRRQDEFCRKKVSEQAASFAEIAAHVSLLPVIRDSVEALRLETKGDIRDLREEMNEKWSNR